jgi:hypothetical protein
MNAKPAPIFARAVAETGHWYDTAGKPAYEVMAKNGQMRGTTLADARKMNLVPSVTTIQKIKAAPALTNWLIEQAILSALTLPRIDGEAERDYIARVKVDGQAQGKAAAAEGTRIHNAIEAFFACEIVPEEYADHVTGVVNAIGEHFPHVNDWVSEASFAHPLGYGGKADLHSPSTGIVIDYKGKDLSPDDPPKDLVYGNHREQLAAYQRGLNLPINVCANLFVSRTHPGHCVMQVSAVEQLAHGWSVFEALLEVWKRENKFQVSP